MLHRLLFLTIFCCLTTAQSQAQTWTKLTTATYSDMDLNDVYANGQNIFAVGYTFGGFTGHILPSDDADKINYEGQAQVMRYVYSIVQKMDGMPKPAFTKTKQTDVGKVRFKVTLGIMPDYSFTEGGVRVDGVTDDRPAQKAGIKAGDIITKIGKHDIRGIQTYMEALAAFEEGEKTEVTVKRDGKEMTMPLQFTAKK